MPATKDLVLPAFRWRRAERPQVVTPAAPASGLAAPTRSGFAALDRELPDGAWPRGEIIEVLVDAPGTSEIALCMPALAQLREADSLWVLPWAPEAATTTLPFAAELDAAGLAPHRRHVHRPSSPRGAWWALEQALRSRQFGVVIAWLPSGSGDGDYRALRRLQGLAADSNTLLIVVREPLAAAWPSPASLRLQIDRRDGEGRLHLRLLRRRGRPLAEPLGLLLHAGRLAPGAARLAS